MSYFYIYIYEFIHWILQFYIHVIFTTKYKWVFIHFMVIFLSFKS